MRFEKREWDERGVACPVRGAVSGPEGGGEGQTEVKASLRY